MRSPQEGGRTAHHRPSRWLHSWLPRLQQQPCTRRLRIAPRRTRCLPIAWCRLQTQTTRHSIRRERWSRRRLQEAAMPSTLGTSTGLRPPLPPPARVCVHSRPGRRGRHVGSCSQGKPRRGDLLQRGHLVGSRRSTISRSYGHISSTLVSMAPEASGTMPWVCRCPGPLPPPRIRLSSFGSGGEHTAGGGAGYVRVALVCSCAVR